MTEKYNNVILEEFKHYMESSGLGKKTVNNHLGNVGLFVNDFLLWEEVDPEDGYEEIGYFFGEWAIRKNIIFSEPSMRQYASSIKKFYKFLYEVGKIDKKTSSAISYTFRDGLPDWLISVRQYEDELLRDEW
jgi:hypothetical protein